VEQHQVNTDGTGMFSISIGNGTRVGGAASGLNAIDWSQGPFYLNLKIAITPVAGNVGWDFNKEWIDIGTTSFGAVPYALYSANAGGVNQKLSITDTTKMLAVYAKAIKVQSLETSLATKLTSADTLTMLAPYARAAYVLDSAYIKAQLKSKMNIADSSVAYVTPTTLNTAINSLVDAGTLTGTVLKSTVTGSSLTSVGTLANLTVTNAIAGSITGNATTATTAANISATSNTTLTSLSNLTSVGTITTGVWSGTAVAVTNGGTGLSIAGTNGQFLTSTGSGTLTWTTFSNGTHYIGETFGGGIVFYVYDEGKHGFTLKGLRLLVLKAIESISSSKMLLTVWFNLLYTWNLAARLTSVTNLTTNCFKMGTDYFTVTLLTQNAIKLGKTLGQNLFILIHSNQLYVRS
jgi:hypothetical protein